jgi:L-fuconolactonase
MDRRIVVDAHVHFWDPGALHYPWLAGVPGLNRAFLPTDFGSLTSASVDAVVFVEANCLPTQSTDEVAFVERLASSDGRIAGIVAFVDLLDERATSEALARLSETSHVVGVRYNIQGHAAGFALDASFVRGVREVGRYGLPFDLCVTADQLREVTDLVRRCPDTRFVLDHCGKPAIRDESFVRWAADLARLAALDNISCKLSGLMTEARANQRGDEALRPYAEHALDRFGTGRLLFGSDWPVVTLGGGDAAWRGFTDRFTATWTPNDRQLFYADNTIRLYGLELDGHS